MNDTHGDAGKGWYGFDLDGTLARYDGWKGIGHIGSPVAPMVDLIRRMHDEGKIVKIVTARIAPKEKPEVERNPFIGRLNPDYAKAYIKSQEEHPSGFYSLVNWSAREFVSDWCLKNLGFLPEIVYQKDHLMLELYDDRVKQVVPNAGVLVEDQRDDARRTAERWRAGLCYALAVARELRKDLLCMKVLWGITLVSLVFMIMAALFS